MRSQVSKLGVKFLIIYLILGVAAFIFYFLTFDKGALAGLYIQFLTYPWSYLLTLILFALDPAKQLPLFIDILILLIFMIINSCILYFVGKNIDKSKRNRISLKNDEKS
jgi:hypothetical protein